MQINPSGLASHPDPYPIYAALRQQRPGVLESRR